MEFFVNKKHGYDFDEFFNHNFLKYKNKFNDKALFYGLEWVLNDNLEKEKLKNNFFKEKIFINNSLPCDFMANNFTQVIKRQNFFDKVYSSCPYASNFLNDQFSTSKYKFVPIPTYSEKLFENYKEINYLKKFDVAFYGGLHSEEHSNILKTMKKFNNVVMSYDNRMNRNFFKWPFFLNYKNFVPNRKKWDILHNTKILVGTNLLYLNDKHIKNFKEIPNIKKFQNYEIVCEKKILPQLKTRMVEAASTKTIFLLKKDEWNVIEEWFTPDEDFIYWLDIKDLEEKIFEISRNFQKYTHIIDSASKKVKEFYFEGFMKKI